MPHFIIAPNKWRDCLSRITCISVAVMLAAVGVVRAGDKRSRWVDKPVVIDGNNQEWPQPYPFKEDIDTRIQYAIANDAQTLYLTLKTSDDATKMKLRKNGLIIIIDTTGKKLSNTLFDFTIQDKSSADQADTSQRLIVTDVRVKGTAAYDGTYKMAHNKPLIAAAAAINDYNEVVVEIAIPFRCIYGVVGEHVTGQDRLSVCFTFFGLSNENIDELERAADKEISNAMPMDSNGVRSVQSSADGGGTPVRGANGGMGVGIGGGKGKSRDNTSSAVIDANAVMLDRHRAGQDAQVWKQIRLSNGE